VTDADLDAWLDRHPGALRTEPRISFRQVYVRPDRRNAASRADAERLLAQLRAAGAEASIERLGDATMLPAEQPLEPLREVARAFGDDFAQTLLKADVGVWTGPIESSFGLHLVLVRERIGAAKAPLAEIRPLVEREVQSERRAAQMQALYDRLLTRYVVTIERQDRPSAAGAKAGK
jgi:hypothetical protein